MQQFSDHDVIIDFYVDSNKRRVLEKSYRISNGDTLNLEKIIYRHRGDELVEVLEFSSFYNNRYNIKMSTKRDLTVVDVGNSGENIRVYNKGSPSYR